MSATYAPESTRTIATSAFRIERIAGFAGLFFALFVGLINVVIGSMGPPAFDASATDITAFVTENHSALKVAAGLVPFGIIALFIFLAGSFAKLSAASPKAAMWTRLGAVGLVLIEVMFMARMIFELVLLANVDKLSADPLLIEIMWQLQNASVSLNGLAIGIALLGLSRAGRLSGLIPAWQEYMGYAAGLGFLVGSIGAVPALQGSLIGMLSFAAFITWLFWLAMTSIRLIRSDRATA
jgi:hypothetical protein